MTRPMIDECFPASSLNIRIFESIMLGQCSSGNKKIVKKLFYKSERVKLYEFIAIYFLCDERGRQPVWCLKMMPLSLMDGFLVFAAGVFCV